MSDAERARYRITQPPRESWLTPPWTCGMLSNFRIHRSGHGAANSRILPRTGPCMPCNRNLPSRPFDSGRCATGSILVRLMNTGLPHMRTSVRDSISVKLHRSPCATRPDAIESSTIARLPRAISRRKDWRSADPTCGITWSGRYSSVAPSPSWITVSMTAGCFNVR